MNKIIKDIIYILVTVLVINVLSCFLFFRWDFTVTKRYSLSKVSKNIIRQQQRTGCCRFLCNRRPSTRYKKIS